MIANSGGEYARINKLYCITKSPFFQVQRSATWLSPRVASQSTERYTHIGRSMAAMAGRATGEAGIRRSSAVPPLPLAPIEKAVAVPTAGRSAHQ